MAWCKECIKPSLEDGKYLFTHPNHRPSEYWSGGAMIEKDRDNLKEAGENLQDKRRVYPIVIYPFTHPRDLSHLEALYEFLSGLDNDVYCRPLTVVNRQTIDNVIRNPDLNKDKQERAAQSFHDFFRKSVEPVSDVHEAWCVDTCQMWLAGFGKASDQNQTIGAVYWLIPGDFYYSTENGQAVLGKIREIPLLVYDNPARVDLAIGEIAVDINSAKQLIDTYGTYGLLYNWFPAEAQGIRRLTDKPRSEFFAISDSFLKHALSRRWYAYEQTIVLLLHAFSGQTLTRGVRKVELGKINDDEAGRSRLDGAMQQIERAERVLKLYWRERNRDDRDWRENFRILDDQSEKIRSAAMVIFEQILT